MATMRRSFPDCFCLVSLRPPGGSVMRNWPIDLLLLLWGFISLCSVAASADCPTSCANLDNVAFPWGAKDGCGSGPGFVLSGCDTSQAQWKLKLPDSEATLEYAVQGIVYRDVAGMSGFLNLTSVQYAPSLCPELANISIIDTYFPPITSQSFPWAQTLRVSDHMYYLLLECEVAEISQQCSVYTSTCRNSQQNCVLFDPQAMGPPDLQSAMSTSNCSHFQSFLAPENFFYPPTWNASLLQLYWYNPVSITDTGCHKNACSPAMKGVLYGVVPAVGLMAFLFILWRFQRKKLNRNTNAEIYFQNQDFSCIEGKLHIFGYHELKAATEDFNIRNQLGKGGFGVVFKGYLSDGTIIAVKQLTSETEKGNIEFMNEVATISSVQHRNLVKLLGCCIKGKRKILVFEFLENNSLHQCLLEKCLFLDWPTRFNICVGIARGLTYLHEESRIRIVHRDIKANNILLDHNMNPKIADFGLAKLFQDDKTHISTCVAGTIGYLAPEYAFRGKLTEKADVYSFGILLLEIVSGRKNLNANLPNELQHLLEWTWQLYEEKQEVSLVDTSLDGQVPEKELLRVIHVALLCAQASAGMRPKMSEALAMLTGTLHIFLNIARPCFLSDLKHFPALREAATESVYSTNSPRPLTNNMAVPSSSHIEPR